MGFDNIKMLEYIVPRLTMVSTNVEKVAAVAVGELIAQITGAEAVPKKIVLPHRILDMETL
ncbi:MAG: substrate-binding domain-containing protein [bacterium]|nr:substrate-binding domain-containing protein [bacterium]